MSDEKAQARVEFAFLADAAEPGLHGKVSALGIGINKIFASSFPAVHQTLALVYRLSIPVDDTATTVKVEFGSAHGGLARILVEQPMPDLARQTGHHVGVLNIVGLEFPEPGQYVFTISLGDQDAAVLNLEAGLRD